MTLKPSDSDDFQSSFTTQYKQEFGFILEKPIIVDDVRVKGIGKSFDTLGKGVWEEMKEYEGREGGWVEVQEGREEGKRVEVYFEGGRVKTKVFLLGNVKPGERIQG